MSESPASPQDGPHRLWLFHPVVDLAVGGGLLALPLAVLAAVLSREVGSAVVVAFGAFSVAVNGPHYAATIVRAWRLRGRPHDALLLASLVAAIVVVAAHVQPVLLAPLFTLYLTWSPWHYGTQNHGLSVLFLARSALEVDGGDANASPRGPAHGTTQGERRLLRALHAVSAAMAIAAVHVGASEPYLWRLGLRLFPVQVFTGVVAVAVVVIGGGLVLRWRRRGVARGACVAVLALLSTSLVWFAIPALMQLGGGGAPGLVYAGGAAALLHCAQYLWVTTFAEGRTAAVSGRRFDIVGYVAVLVAGGVLLFTLVPWSVSRLLGYDLIVSLLIFQATVNLHHYVVDAFVWKLRDPEVRAPLVRGTAFGPARREEVSNLKAIVATVGVVATLVLGAIDVLQLAGTRVDASDDSRVRAMAFNPNDSRLWVQDAQVAVANNDVEGAKNALARAVALSPSNADAQRALLRFHVATGNLEDAWARRAAAPTHTLADAASQAILADVALRLEHLDDAVTIAEDILADGTLSPVSGAAIEARRILGTARLAQDKPGEARAILQQALDDAEANNPGVDIVRGGNLLELALHLGESLVLLRHFDPALVLFDRALEGAGVANRPDVAFRALTGRASVALAKEDPRAALEHLQRALRLSEALPDDDDRLDQERVARTWLDYGGLLAKSDSPMAARYACALRAQRRAEAMPPGEEREELLRFIAEATRFVVEVLPADAQEAVRTDVKAAAAEALELRYPTPDEEPPATPTP